MDVGLVVCVMLNKRSHLLYIGGTRTSLAVRFCGIGWKDSRVGRLLLVATQEASWTNPNEGAESQVAGGAMVAREAEGGGTGGERGGAAGPETLSQPEDGRAKWTECLDEASGSTYYYNVITVCVHQS